MGILLVDFFALRLAVRAVRAAHIGAFVPFQAQPAQAVDQLLLGAFHIALAVGIFDPQNKLPASLAGQQKIIQGGSTAPRWVCPVGDGANRTRTGLIFSVMKRLR
jgi:hypothetical protein